MYTLCPPGGREEEEEEEWHDRRGHPGRARGRPGRQQAGEGGGGDQCGSEAQDQIGGRRDDRGEDGPEPDQDRLDGEAIILLLLLLRLLIRLLLLPPPPPPPLLTTTNHNHDNNNGI